MITVTNSTQPRMVYKINVSDGNKKSSDNDMMKNAIILQVQVARGRGNTILSSLIIL